MQATLHQDMQFTLIKEILPLSPPSFFSSPLLYMAKVFVLYLFLSWPPLKATPPLLLIQNLRGSKAFSPLPVWFWAFVLSSLFVCVSVLSE